MAIARKLVGIAASTLPTLPVNLPGLAAHPPQLAFLPSQFGLLFCFQKRRDDRLDGSYGCGFGLLLDFLEHACALLALQFPLGKVSTHDAEDSLWRRFL